MVRKADVAQSVEHSLGKGEVVGSIPIISSRFWWIWASETGSAMECNGGQSSGLVLCRYSGKRGSNSVVESQPSKLLVAGSIPVSRSR